jgi:hypothetical protein
MEINDKKTVCMRIGPRYDACCSDITTFDGKKLTWVADMRYLGVCFVSSRTFKCCYDNAKKSLYRSFNAIFGHIGRSASAEVILSLIKAKCLPTMLYGLEACPINAGESKSLDFPITRVLMKIFNTNCKDIIADCQLFFAFPSVHELVSTRKISFLRKYAATENDLCYVCAGYAQLELKILRVNNN